MQTKLIQDISMTDAQARGWCELRGIPVKDDGMPRHMKDLVNDARAYVQAHGATSTIGEYATITVARR